MKKQNNQTSNNSYNKKPYTPLQAQSLKSKETKKVQSSQQKVQTSQKPYTFLNKDKVASFQKKIVNKSYVFIFGSFFIGMKICDLIFYNPKRLEIVRQQMEDQFWAINGQPKHLKPQIVQSVANPNKFRNSWIQVVLGKDNNVPKLDI